MNEKSYGMMEVNGRLELVPLSKYAAGIMQIVDETQIEAIEKGRKEAEDRARAKHDEQNRQRMLKGRALKEFKPRVLVRPTPSPMVDESSITYYFSQLKAQICELVGDDALESLAAIDEIERDVLGWERESNPVRRLEQDMRARGCTELSVGSFLGAARRYMRFTSYEPTFSKKELTAFLASLSSSKGTTRHYYRAMLKTWMLAMEREWPFGRQPFHYESEDSEAACYSADEVRRQIRLFKGKGSDACKFYMSLATAFGFRSIEEGRVNSKSFFSSNGDTFIRVKTAKRHDGHHRQHRIPEQILPYIEPYIPKAVALPAWKLREMYCQWCKEVGYSKPEGFGFHALRHSLNSNLIEQGIDSVMVDSWMGWKSGRKGTPIMAMAYYRPQELEDRIYQKHPFLEEWGQL